MHGTIMHLGAPRPHNSGIEDHGPCEEAKEKNGRNYYKHVYNGLSHSSSGFPEKSIRVGPKICE